MDIQKLQGFVPDNILEQLPDTYEKFDISNEYRLAHFIGQTAEETGVFKVFIENLNYSGDALYKLFKIHFKDQVEADSYARQPERIANRIYANRMGNRDEQSDDGFLYRGRGSLQTTGKANYKALSDYLGVDVVSNPDLVATDYIMAAGAFFFTNNNLWSICDRGVDVNNITTITRKVNGGLTNLSNRITYTNKAYSLLTS